MPLSWDSLEQETISDHVTQVREQLGREGALQESRDGVRARATHPVTTLNPAARAKSLNIEEMMFVHGLGHGGDMLIVTSAMTTHILFLLILLLCMLMLLTRKGNWVGLMHMHLHTSRMDIRTTQCYSRLQNDQ